MPFEIFGKYRIVVADYDKRDKIWPIVSRRYTDKFGNETVFDQKAVDERLKYIFTTLIALFTEKITLLNDASFVIFTHMNNEKITSLLFDQYNGFKIEHEVIREDDLAVDRRVYKIILEQLTKNDLVHDEFIDTEIINNADIYEEYLGELLYIGNQIYYYKYMISKNAFLEGCLKVSVLDNGNVAFITVPPFMEILDEIVNQFKIDANYITKHNYVNELYTTLDKELNIQCKDAIGILQTKGPQEELGYFDIESVIATLSNDDFKYSKDGLRKFYAGLTISRNNILSIEDSYLRSQSNNRYLYRPLLQLHINGKVYYKLGNNKYIESYNSIVFNSLPYGQLPNEWLSIKAVRKLMGNVQNENDKVLEDPICEMINKKGLFYDRNIKSLLTNNMACNFPINIKGVGEIDIMFISFRMNTCIIHVCECKNNRFRDDFYNWRRDYSNFLKSYEKQLAQKMSFLQKNIEKVKTHFKRKFEENLFDNFEIEVKGIFIINAPTLYMYDGAVEVYNYKTFSEYLDGTYTRTIFVLNNEDDGSKFHLEYPYLRNLRHQMYKLSP